ncbi:MAG: hypothetical protein GY943_03160 [Chloroflexi bacterium]|nr:hypothetical protein [Chloroflexota bacterium]
MYPEDRVLVAYVPKPSDFAIIQNNGWYRIPQKSAPKGLFAEYFAFYFGQRFGKQKWAIHYFAEQLGNELISRCSLFPDQADHPRADDLYYKVQLGSLHQLKQPIVSLRWRRITFLHTTWDRFQDATEINDLFVEGGEYVDRLYATLKDRGIQTQRAYRIQDGDERYADAPLVVFCKNGRIPILSRQIPKNEGEFDTLVNQIEADVEKNGGAI